MQPPSNNPFEHESIEKERLAHEQERLTKHVVAPTARAEFEKADQTSNFKAQAIEDQKVQAMLARKSSLPAFDPKNKDAPGGFKMLDAFEVQTLVTLRNNELTAAINDGRWNDLWALFSRTGGVVGVGGKEFSGKAEVVGYFQRLRDGGLKNLKHTPGSYRMDNDHTITEWASKYESSSASGTYSINWHRAGQTWVVAKLTYHS